MTSVLLIAAPLHVALLRKADQVQEHASGSLCTGFLNLMVFWIVWILPLCSVDGPAAFSPHGGPDRHFHSRITEVNALSYPGTGINVETVANRIS